LKATKTKEMNMEKTLLILWIIFGFVFVQAIDSVLFLTTHLMHFGAVYVGISYPILNFIIPALTTLSYLVMVIFILKKIKIKSGIRGILLTGFPKKKFYILLTLALVLNPITNKLNTVFSEWVTGTQDGNAVDFLAFHGWMYLGIGLARWTSIIVLAGIYLNNYRLKPSKTGSDN
jgi:hypothetical protein